MNVRRLATKGLLCAAIAVGTLPLAAVQASAGGNGNGNLNGGCGAGFTESTIDGTDGLAQFAADRFIGGPTADEWAVFFHGLDKNGDQLLCWHPTGKVCSCGANAINVVDDNANATFE